MIRHWLAAIRPRTLPVAVVPVLVGSVLAWHDAGALSLPVVLATALAAVLIQAATNLHNDVADYERGADDPRSRLGPPRATAEGWLTPGSVRIGAALLFSAAAVVGTWLVAVGGWPILLVGIASIVSGWAYSGGPLPIAYTRLGEPFVWLFFGVIAVSGSYYLQAAQLTLVALAAGAVLGLPAAAVLVVNNYRDLEHDRRAGRRTFAVSFGRPASRGYYALLMLLPFACLPLFALAGTSGWLLAYAALPWALLLVRRFVRGTPGQTFNVLLGDTARFQLAFGVLVSAGLLLAGPRAG
jgi:1,4-dihydroxy-2-naphthoate octaprenyltransferase